MSTLIDTLVELRQYVPINYNFTMELMAPHLRRAERTYLVPVLGEAFIAELEAHQNDSSSATDAVLDAVLALAQEAEAHLAVRYALPFLSVQVGDAGLHITQTENYRPPYQWQVGDLSQGLHESGMAAIEALYQYLENNQGEASLATWAASTARTTTNDTLLPSAAAFDRHYRIGGSRITYVDLVPAIRRATALHLHANVGKAFCDELIAHQNSEDSSSSSSANDSALELLQAALAHLAIGEAKEVLFRYVNGGLMSTRMEANQTTKQSVIDDRLHLDMVQNQRRAATDIGTALLAQARAYLDQNSDLYPTYAASTYYRSDVADQPVVADQMHNTTGMTMV